MRDWRVLLGIFSAPFLVLFALVFSIFVYCFALIIYPYIALIAIILWCLGEGDEAMEFVYFWIDTYKRALERV